MSGNAGLDTFDLLKDNRRISRHLLLELSWARALERGLSEGQLPCLWLQLSATPLNYSGSDLYNSHTPLHKERNEKKSLRFSAIITGVSRGGSPELTPLHNLLLQSC